MKRSFLALACAGSFLATFTSESVAQIGGPYVYNPTPTPIPDAPEATRPGNGGYMASFPGYKPPPKDTNVYPPTISGARMFNGRLRFTFTGSSPTTLRYIIGWSRPGLAEVSDMRWTGPRHETGRVIEEYIINEKPMPDTVYNFRVQAQGKNKINGQYPADEIRRPVVSHAQGFEPGRQDQDRREARAFDIPPEQIRSLRPQSRGDLGPPEPPAAHRTKSLDPRALLTAGEG